MLSGAHLGFKELKIMPKQIEELLITQAWPWIEIANDLQEGKGVIAKQDIQKQHVVCNYGGDVFNENHAKKNLLCNPKICDYLFEFKIRQNGKNKLMYRNHDNNSPFSFGKFLNHSKKHPNLICKLFVTSSGEPDILFITKVKIQKGEQLVWDYGAKYAGVKDCVSNCSKCKLLKNRR